MPTTTDKQYLEAQLASFWYHKFKEAMVHKAPYTKRWQMYWDAYQGDYFRDKRKPDYKSDLVSNYIFGIIETIRPIMLDNDPKFQALPRQPEGMEFSNDLQEAFLYEWDRERMSSKLSRELITTLVYGTTPYFIPWDKSKKEIRAIPFSPFNLFPDPLATSVEDAEYLIYAVYKNVVRLKQMFPKHAERLQGGNVNYSELVHDNNRDANLDNQVLILEVWTRDYESVQDDKGNVKQKYPRGRVLTIAPELGLVLSDRENPYVDGRFPFVLHKDYDIPGKFWGEGEVAQLLSPQKEMNELNNAILDNAKATANMPWIVDKNSGIPYGKISNRPGLIIRKNPGTEVRRDQPPSMPNYVVNAIETYKMDMEQISGVFDTLKGNSETGVYTAQGILALQEAGQARIRLKVKVMEEFLRELAELWYSRMKQFWTSDRWVRITRPDGSYDFKSIKRDMLRRYDYDIKIMAGSTMPVNRGAMLDLMIRLAQTQMPDGQTLVDREAVVEYLPVEVKSALLRRMGNKQLIIEQQIKQLTQMAEQLEQDLTAIVQESRSADEQTFDVIEELTGQIEQLHKQILQLQKHYDKMEEERKQEEERTKLRNEGYNEGYSDAERLLSAETNPAPTPDTLDGESPITGDIPITEEGDELDDLGEGSLGGLPEDILSGLENLTDEELSLLLMENPQLADLLR